MHTELIASEMHKMGFQAKTMCGMVEISLKNRKVSEMEIKIALESIFDNTFNLNSTSNGVLVN